MRLASSQVCQTAVSKVNNELSLSGINICISKVHSYCKIHSISKNSLKTGVDEQIRWLTGLKCGVITITVKESQQCNVSITSHCLYLSIWFSNYPSSTSFLLHLSFLSFSPRCLLIIFYFRQFLPLSSSLSPLPLHPHGSHLSLIHI